MADVTDQLVEEPGARYPDFDAAVAAIEAEPVRFRLLGQLWELPAEMPTAVVLKVSRWLANGRTEDTLTMAEMLDLAADLVPRRILDRWLDLGLRPAHLEHVIPHLLSAYIGADAAGGGQGNGQAPQAPPSSTASSPAGQPSRPTTPEPTATASGAP